MTLKITSIVLSLTIMSINLDLVAFLLAGSHGNLGFNIETVFVGSMAFLLLISALALDLHTWFRFTGRIESFLFASLRVLVPLSFLITIYLIYELIRIDLSSPYLSFQPMVYVVHVLTALLIMFVLHSLFIKRKVNRGRPA